MTDLPFPDATLEHDGVSSMPPTDIGFGSNAARDAEIQRLREENERLRKGLQEIRQLLEQPPHPGLAASPKMLPTIGLL